MTNYILRISLNDTDIWRRISFPQGYTFSQLHEIIQIIFGWENSHLHEFRTARWVIVTEELEEAESIEEKFKYEGDADLDLIFMDESVITYLYDYGDNWELSIEVENVVDGGEGYPQLLEFSGTMAMENCGGVEGLKKCEGKIGNLEEINIILKDKLCT